MTYDPDTREERLKESYVLAGLSALLGASAGIAILLISIIL